MTTKKTKIYRLGLLAIVCFCLTFLATMFLCDNRVASAAENEAKEIYVGDVIQASEYTLSYGGKEVKAEGLTAVYPSGGVFGGEVFQSLPLYRVLPLETLVFDRQVFAIQSGIPPYVKSKVYPFSIK